MIEDSSALGEQPPRKQSRRQILLWSIGVAVAALGAGFIGYNAISSQKTTIRLGIAPGSQTMWRYLAQRRVELFGPTRYDPTFSNFPDESALRAAFVAGEIDVIASLVPTVATLAEGGIAAQLFLPMAWLHEGFPFIVPAQSSITDLAGLRGRKVAVYPLDHPGMAYWHALALATANLPLRALNIIETLTPNGLLIDKKVEAGSLSGSQWAALQADTGFRKLTDLQSTWKRHHLIRIWQRLSALLYRGKKRRHIISP